MFTARAKVGRIRICVLPDRRLRAKKGGPGRGWAWPRGAFYLRWWLIWWVAAACGARPAATWSLSVRGLPAGSVMGPAAGDGANRDCRQAPAPVDSGWVAGFRCRPVV